MGLRHEAFKWAEPLKYFLPQTQMGLGPETEANGGRNAMPQAAHFGTSSLTQFPVLKPEFQHLQTGDSHQKPEVTPKTVEPPILQNIKRADCALRPVEINLSPI